MCNSTVASKLSSCVRSIDTVSRVGGDEFVILLPEIEQTEDVERVAKKIVALADEPVFCLEHKLQILVGIGIAVSALDDEDANGLIKKADSNGCRRLILM